MARAVDDLIDACDDSQNHIEHSDYRLGYPCHTRDGGGCVQGLNKAITLGLHSTPTSPIMSTSDEDKAAAAAIKTKANEAFKCEPTRASNSQKLTRHVLGGA